MVRNSSFILRAILSRPFLLMLLVGALAFVPTLFNASSQAVTTPASQGTRNAEPPSSSLEEIDNELLSIEHEFDNYLAQAAVDSPESQGLWRRLNEVTVQLLGRLATAKDQLQNSRSHDRASRDGFKRIARLEEKILRQQNMYGQPAVSQTRGIGYATGPANIALQVKKLKPTATGAISGTVTNAVGGAAIQNVFVQIYGSTGSFITSVATNVSGIYTSPATLATGNYYLRTSNSLGFIDELYNDITCLSCSVTGGAPVSVTDGATTPNINFALPTGGRISGTITDAGTAALLQNVSVSIYDSSGNFQTSVSTDVSGNYTSNGLPAGTYYANTFNSLGYINKLYNNITCAPCTLTSGTPITATVGVTTSGINFSLAAGGRISGTVTDSASATPLANVTVQIYNSAGTSVTFANTDSLGNYISASGLLTGTYYASTFNSLGYINEVYDNIVCLSCNPTTGTPISVTIGATTSGRNFGLAAGGRISGTITNSATSAPLASVSVAIYSSTGVFVTSAANSDAAGNYISSSGLPTGTYYARTNNSIGFVNELYNNIPCVTCTVTTGTPISVTAGVTTSGRDFGLAAGGRISGTVTDSSTAAPLVNVSVQIYNSGGVFQTSISTDVLGNYNTTGLPTGSYFAQTSNSLGYVNKLYNNITCAPCTVTTGTLISVTTGVTTSGINFALALGGRISGTVTNSSTSAPLANVIVFIYNSSGTFVTSGFSDSAGNYISFLGLPAGTYYAVTSNSQNFVDELYDNLPCAGSCTVTTGTPIAVTSGATTSGRNFALAAGGRISGTITDATTMAPINAIYVDIYNSSGSFVTSGFSDSSGNYISSTGLPAGTYYAVTSNSQNFVDEVYNNINCLDCVPTSGTPITVTAGTTTSGINFDLAPGGSITGTVTNAATSAPISGVSVRIFNSSGTQITSVNTDGTGAYSSNIGLPTGTYYAGTFNALGFLDELYDNLPCAGSCTVTTGTPIPVTSGVITSGRNFALAAGGSISGTITNAATLAPIQNVVVQISASTGAFITTATTNASGNYMTSVGLATGIYYARTTNSLGYVNELYDNITCLTCTTTSGTPISVTGGSATTGINFALVLGGSISGTITNASTLAPIQNITVQVLSSTGAFITTAITNSSGIYSTSVGLTTGTYYARTTNNLGYINELYDNITCLTCSTTTGTLISVTSGSTTAGINFALAVGGQISGTVTDATTSGPLNGVNARIYNSLGQQVAAINSNASGVYTTNTGLTTGTYYARAFSSLGFVSQSYAAIDCLTCTPTLGTPISVTAGSTTTGINFALTPGGRISGTLTDAVTAAPLAGVQVQIYTSSGALITNTSTNGSGAYTSPAGLLTGSYYLRTSNQLGYIDKVYATTVCGACDVTTGTPVSVTTGATTSGINLALTAGGRVSGTITNSVTLAPLPDIDVDIFDLAGNFITFGSTDGLGNYTSGAGLPSGTYHVVTFNGIGYIDELYNNISCPGEGCDLSVGTAVTVTSPSTTSGINFALAPGGGISGMATDATTSAPLSGITVQIYNSLNIPVASGTTNTTGTYTVPPVLATGTYYARAINSIGYVRELYNNLPCLNCVVTTGTPIAVTAGLTTSGISFTLDAGGRIFGAVNDISNLTSISGAQVEVYNTSGTLVAIAGLGTLGNYTAPALPAGTYFARTTNTRGFVNKLYNDIPCLACTVTTGNPIAVSVGTVTSGINFTLCQMALSSTSAFFTINGNEGSFNLITSSGCAWSATSNDPWIELTSEGSGSGSATISYLVRDNFSLTPRQGTISIAGLTFTVTQDSETAPDCTFAISPAFEAFSASGGAGSISVTAEERCAWQAVSNASWVTITSGCCAIGNGTVSYSVGPNPGTSGRAATITIADKTFNVKQKGN